MDYRRVGRSGLTVSRLGLGTMTWGSAVDSYEANDQLTTFLDAGGTLIDTAPIYGDGACEELLGGLLGKTGVRDDIVLAGKAGFVRRRGQVVKDGSRRTLLDQLDLSLSQLGTDHLDLWQIHSPDPDVPLEETLAALEHAVRTAAEGGLVFGSAVAGRVAALVAAGAARPAEPPFPGLTDRERRVLDLLAAGRTNDAIARELHVSGKTVRNAVSALYAKLGVADRAAAIVVARDAGLGRG